MEGLHREETGRDPATFGEPVRVHGFDLLRHIHEEFEHSPEMQLNLADAQLRWDVDVLSLQTSLQALVLIGYLKRSTIGVYSRREASERAKTRFRGVLGTAAD
jgi:hypothetical protein